VAGLREQGWTVPETQGNFFWLGVGPATTALAEHFRAAGILVRPFAGEGVRVSVGTPEENDRVLAAAASFAGLAEGTDGGGALTQPCRPKRQQAADRESESREPWRRPGAPACPGRGSVEEHWRTPRPTRRLRRCLRHRAC